MVYLRLGSTSSSAADSSPNELAGHLGYSSFVPARNSGPSHHNRLFKRSPRNKPRVSESAGFN